MDTMTPLPVLPSPKFHAYDVAFVVALASKVQLRPEQVKLKLATGAGAGLLTVTDCDEVLLPLASVTVRPTVYVLGPAYVCDVVFPVPEAASPNVHAYVALDSAVLPLASKSQVRPEHAYVYRATGAVVDEPPPMNPV